MAEHGTEGAGRSRWLTLVAMTIANSMILIDQTAVPLAIPHAIADIDGSLETSQWILTANVLPLAALMVFGGRLGDQLGLRRIFLLGSTLFILSSALAGAAQDMPWMITMRVAQGIGAALMMPTTLAIIAAVFPERERGRALGLMAGASAFFAALGPVLGGLLTEYVDWRAVFLVNVPLGLIVIAITLRATPALPPAAGERRSIDLPGVAAFAIGIGAFTLGLGQSQDWGWGGPTLIALAVGVVGLVAFVAIERRQPDPLVDFGLFRHLNFTAANVSQVLAGAVELATAFLLPYFLLLVVGLSPGAAGLALLPATLPIILIAPLAGRWFDRSGGRPALVIGFLVLGASSFALAAGFGAQEIWPLVPGLVLQGVGLGLVLTVNDPIGLGSVPAKDQGQASGIIDTTEQMGGAIGIAVFLVVFLHFYFGRIYDLAAERGFVIGEEQLETGRRFVLSAEQEGFRQATVPAELRGFGDAFKDAHVYGYRVAFILMGVVSLVGALAGFLLVRGEDRLVPAGVVTRRSRWARPGRTAEG